MASSNIEAMKNTDEAFKAVEDGLAGVMGEVETDYSNGKKKKTILVQEMNSQAHNSIMDTIEGLDKEIASLDSALVGLKEGRADAKIALEALNVSSKYIEDKAKSK